MQFSFVALTLLANTILAASNVYMTVKGAKQGVIKGGSNAKGHAGSFEIDATALRVAVPFDARTGQSTGKRQHQPISVSTASSPAFSQFLSAAATNELLPEIVLVYTGRGAANGVETAIQTVTLKNAMLVDLSQSFSSTGGFSDNMSFSFQSMQVASSAATAVDDWNVAANA